MCLDAARTRAETRPLCVVHRLADVLTDYESQRQDRQAMHMDMAARAVSVGSRTMAFVTSEELRWTPASQDRYSWELRDEAAAIVSSA